MCNDEAQINLLCKNASGKSCIIHGASHCLPTCTGTMQHMQVVAINLWAWSIRLLNVQSSIDIEYAISSSMDHIDYVTGIVTTSCKQ